MFPDPTSRSAELFARAVEVMPGGGTRHPIMFAPYLVYAAGASGCRVTDVDGVERIDFINNYSCQIHGHAHPRLVAAIRDQAAQITSAILPTEAELSLAGLLCERVPAIDKVYAHMFEALKEPRFVVTSRIGQGAEWCLLWDFRFRFQFGQAQTIRGASHLRLAPDGRIEWHRDYWDAAEELYEKLPVLGALMRWLKRRARG